MSRTLIISFAALVLVIGAAGAAPAAHAQPAAPAAAPAAAPSVAGATTGQNNPTLPSLSLADGFSGVMIFLMGIFAWLLGVAAITLDNAVYYTVVTMGNYVHNLAAVGVTWRILRDLSNIVLIFGFLAIGISIILDLNVYGWGQKMLPMLLIVAVFLNFSLFITEAIIDTGNLFATEFYTQINGGAPAGAKNFDSISSVSNEGISSKIMSQLGLATIYSSALTNNGVLKPMNTTFIGFMSIILFLIAAFVMFSLAFILIARFVALIFLIILAPIGFVGLAVPMLSKYAKQWWDYLISQTITAPVLLLMLYVALTIITDVHFLAFGPVGSNGWAGFVPNANGTTNLTGFASLILSFLVAMGLLLAVVIFAKKLSAFGAIGATKLASRLSGATLLAAGVGRGTNYIGRNTLGRAGNTRIGKTLGIGGLANKSFDVRSAGLFKSAKKYTGLDLGAGQKEGYKAFAKKAELKQAEKNTQAAEKSHNEAQAEHNTATAEHAKQNAEVTRLEAEKAREVKFSLGGTVTLETEQKLDVARTAAAKSKTDVEETSKKLAEIETDLKEKNEVSKRARGEINKMKDLEALEGLTNKIKEFTEKNGKEGTEKKVEKKEVKTEEKK